MCYDFKVASTSAVEDMLKSKDLDPALFISALIEHIKEDGLTSNQHVLLGEIALKAMFKKVDIKADILKSRS